MTLIRYPGAKTKLAEDIINSLPDELVVPLQLSPSVHYVEPFFGSGAVGLAVMKLLHRRASVTLADADIGIACLWQAVRDYPKELIRRVLSYSPSVESFYELKQADGEFTDTVDTGFRKLALHRISMSGFGFMSGGPIGGRSQGSKYTVDCRWKPERRIKYIERVHSLFSRFSSLEILHADVFDVLSIAEEKTASHDHSFVYLDPPYYEKGDQLYKHKFSDASHRRLSEVLHSSSFDWSLSYDDHPVIRELYSDDAVRRLEITYTNAVCTGPDRRKNHEILIQPSAVLSR